MNILVLTTKLLTSEDSGYTRRLYPFLKCLKSKGHNITLVSFYEDDAELKNVEVQNEYYNKIITVKKIRFFSYFRMLRAFWSRLPFKVEFINTFAMKNAIAKEMKQNHYDILYSHFSRMSLYFRKYNKQNCVVDLCDSNYMVYDRSYLQEKNLIRKLFLKMERDRIYKFERDCIQRYSKCIFISEVDQKQMDPSNRCAVISNGIDTEIYSPQEMLQKNKNEINYIGFMSSTGNHTAVMYFLEKIYPIIKRNIPDVTFKIIGSNPRKELLNFAAKDSSVKVTGTVDNIRQHALSAMVTIAPMIVVSGLQNKILEAMAMGLPVVTTTAGAEGISFDENILKIADTEEDFAQKVCELLKNENLRQEMSKRARQFCIDNFSWNYNAAKLEKVLQIAGGGK